MHATNAAIAGISTPSSSEPTGALSLAEAARHLGVGVSTIRVAMREGRLGSIKILRRRLIPRSEVERVLREGA